MKLVPLPNVDGRSPGNDRQAEAYVALRDFVQLPKQGTRNLQPQTCEIWPEWDPFLALYSCHKKFRPGGSLS